MKIVQFIKDWTLPLAMVVGIAGYKVMPYLSVITGPLIFVMLLLSFCKISHRDLKIKPLHIYLILIQLLCATGAYLLLKDYNPIVGQGALICFIAPTATAAVVITMKLGGNGNTLTSYVMLINLVVAIAVPIIFPLVHPNPDLSFFSASMLILSKVFPLLIAPFILAWALGKWAPKLHDGLANLHELAFYLWAFSLIIVTGITFDEILASESDGTTQIMLAVVSLVACAIQFFVGKMIGGKYNDRISGGQALGQKNTILAIWMAHTYLNPLSAVAPGAYVLWQNVFNSWQLWRKRKS
jgi:BASS family bile acid:Na+ symporter